jgi:hypothetical protein
MSVAAAMAAQPNELAERVARASELLRHGRIDQARGEITRAVELAPSDPRARNLRGILEFHDQRFDEALMTYHELVAESPADAALRLNLGLVYLKLNETEVAITELNRVLEMRPGHQRALGYLGLAYARRGDFARARDAFAAAGQPALARQMVEESMKGTLQGEPWTGSGAMEVASTPVVGDFRTAELTPPHAGIMGSGNLAALASADDTSFPGGDHDALAEWADIPSSMSLAPLAESRSIPGNGAFGPGTASGVVISEHGYPPASTVEPAPSGAAAGGARGGDEPHGAVAPGQEGAGSGRGGWGEPPARAAGRSAFAGGNGGVATVAGASSHSGGATTAGRPLMTGTMPALLDGNWPSAAVGDPHRSSQRLRDFVRGRLVRADANAQGPRLRVGPGGVLTAQIERRLFVRTDGVLASIGELAYEPACRRIRGRMVPELLGGEDRPVYCVGGRGLLVIGRGALATPFHILELRDETLYIHEDILWGFEETLHWENGRVPRAAALPLVQFRGDGKLAVRMGPRAVCVPVTAGEVLYCDSRRLLGWQGRVVPRAVESAPNVATDGVVSTPFIECIGDGVVIVDHPDEVVLAEGSDGSDYGEPPITVPA